MTTRDLLAKAIWAVKPDSGGMGKPWPFDGKTPKEIRTIKHDIPAQLELCFIYADVAIKFFESSPGRLTPQNTAERVPSSDAALLGDDADIVKRLLAPGHNGLMDEAAHDILDLQKEVHRYRTALEAIANDIDTDTETSVFARAVLYLPR